jgi:3-methylcrotonyl-CoA carboxylase alpha subunit
MQGFLIAGGEAHAVVVESDGKGGRRLPGGRIIALGAVGPDGATHLSVGDLAYSVIVARQGSAIWVHIAGRAYEARWQSAIDHFAQESDTTADHRVRAPMPGSVVSLLQPVGSKVVAGQPIVVIESMKLESTLRAPCAGEVCGVLVAEGATFERDAILAEIRPD